MKYTVEFKCGHLVQVELFGKVKERERRMEYYHDNCLCSECKAKELKAKEAEQGIARPDFLTGYWNGKIYGYGETKSIYIDGNKYEMTAEELKSLQDYLKAKEGK